MFDNSIVRDADTLREVKNGPIRIAAIQMAAGPKIAGNLEEAARLLEIAAAQGAKLAALPEYFCIMGMKDADKVAVREQDDSGTDTGIPEQNRETPRYLAGRRYRTAGVVQAGQGKKQLPGL